MALYETRLLVIHDAHRRPGRLVAALESSGFTTATTRIADDLAQTVRTTSPALILFDVSRGATSLPLCAVIARSSESPLVVIGRENEDQRLLGFELGAADYIC